MMATKELEVGDRVKIEPGYDVWYRATLFGPVLRDLDNSIGFVKSWFTHASRGRIYDIQLDGIHCAVPERFVSRYADTVVDWRNMDAGQELQKHMAEMLGWTDLCIEEIYEEDYYDSGFQSVLTGIHPKRKEELLVPDWPNDLSAAYRLFESEDPITIDVSLFLLEGKAICRIGSLSARMRDKGDGHAALDKPALAVCRAVLDRLERERGDDPQT